MVSSFPSVNGYCEHIHTINTNSTIKTHALIALFLRPCWRLQPYLSAREEASCVLRVWLPFSVDAGKEENDEGLLSSWSTI